MAELNLKQITDKLNNEFAGDTRRLIFWYDDKAEFAEDIDTLELVNARVYHLEPDNQFYTKYLLERQDLTTNYLIYAPFPKPAVRDNHLEDMLLYSKQFFADRASLLCVDLGIDEQYKPIIQKYARFFQAKDRTRRFYKLEIENFTRDTIEIALMSVLCRTKTASFEEVVRAILTDGEIAENKYLIEFEKFDLLPVFWRLCEAHFGYNDVKPSLEKLLLTFFVTYTFRHIQGELPQAWQGFVAYKSGSIIAFLDNLMNNLQYRDRYNELADTVAKTLNVSAVLETYPPEALLNGDSFTVIDELIIGWIIERLLSQDMGGKLKDMTIPEVCQKRSKMHFGKEYWSEYQMLENAYYVIQGANYSCPDDFKEIIRQYLAADYIFDTAYRYFYYWFDQLTSSHLKFEQLRDLVENIYSNKYLSQIISKWNMGILSEEAITALPLQRKFYSKYISRYKDRVVVIISDALRYETGRSLSSKLQDDAKCSAQIEAMLGVLPTYTRLGMAALLPHKSLEMTDDYNVLVDGLPCDDLKQRENILQNHSPDSCSIQFDDIKAMKRDAVRQFFTGQDIIYIYHNQIDARGDKPNTENEVFIACEEAIDEIYNLIKRLTEDVSATQYVVTADHGFIYKRDKLQESDKIANVAGKTAWVNRRFIISDKAINEDGICSIPLGRILGNNDSKIVSFPLSSNVFKVAGGGQNYVHGGSSPQEMLIPVVQVKTEKGHKETNPVQITLVSMIQKITNLITTLDFIQNEPISDTVKATSYRIFFVSEENEKISNENIFVADLRETDPQKRIFRLRFNFKNKQYDKSQRYYVVAYDEKNDMEILRHAVVMDIAFADDFGFNV